MVRSEIPLPFQAQASVTKVRSLLQGIVVSRVSPLSLPSQVAPQLHFHSFTIISPTPSLTFPDTSSHSHPPTTHTHMHTLTLTTTHRPPTMMVSVVESNWIISAVNKKRKQIPNDAPTVAPVGGSKQFRGVTVTRHISKTTQVTM